MSRSRAGPCRVDAFIDTYGEDYAELAVNALGVEPSRVDTIVRFDAPDKYGAKAGATPLAPAPGARGLRPASRGPRP